MGIVIFTGNNNGSDDKINTSKISPNFLTFHSIHFSFSLSSLYRGRELFRIETRRQARSTAVLNISRRGTRRAVVPNCRVSNEVAFM